MMSSMMIDICGIEKHWGLDLYFALTGLNHCGVGLYPGLTPWAGIFHPFGAGFGKQILFYVIWKTVFFR